MDVRLTDDEIEEIDKMMNDHMYGHSISNSYANFACDPRCRMRALQYAINKVLEEKPVGHGLAQIIVESPTRATYLCVCGAEGTATMAVHLGSLSLIRQRAIKNHELHQVRALRREKKT